MSSDGSVSSRISQFGLYRTIDARTEEFLKLSKERQIKQGCVCAAISTALTVTVVVTVLLIYEYNVIAEARRSSHKTNWLSLMNKSADDPNLIDIFNKEKIDIDKTTLKLLPILLKALNRNRYIEKIIDEPTSLYTPYQKEVTTESTITKNIFADTRNWMKTPHSRLYTIEYKTSPIVYFKNPTRNVEYFTKIRKIRDYQRILNYVDKMISDKNSLGTTQPMKRDYGHTEQPYKMTTHTRKHKPAQKMVKQEKKSLKPAAEENTVNCKCFHKLSEVIYKLLNSIQQLLSYLSGSDSKKLVHCDNNSPVQTKPLNEISTVKNIYKVITENYNAFEPKITKTPEYKTFLNRHKYTIDSPTKGFDIRRDYTVNAIMNLIKPHFNKHNDVDINFESNEAFSTTNSYLKSSDVNDILKHSNSKVYSKPNNNPEVSTNTVTTVADYILQKGTFDVSSNVRSSVATFPESDFSDDDDYTEAVDTTTMLPNSFNRLDTYSLQLVKNNLISKRKNVSTENKLYPFKGVRMSKKLFDNIGSMRKMGNLVSNDNKNSLFLPNPHRFAPILKHNSIPTTTTTKSRSNYKSNIAHTIKPVQKPITTKNITKAKEVSPKDKTSEQNRTNNVTPTKKPEKVLNENSSKEITLKGIEEEIMILNNETTTSTNQIENYDKITADYQWEVVRLEENATSTKSMIPMSRSTYLEMQRNDWKHEDNHDFDNDLNYIFD